MRSLSFACGVLGVLVVAVAVVGRLLAGPTKMFFGVIPFSHALIVGNTLLLLAVFLKGCCQCSGRKDSPPDKTP